jgi:peptidoglycan hydrolase-like protein with peptidoglycan-binding domain
MLYASRYLRIMNPLMEGPDVQYVQKRLKELGFRGSQIHCNEFIASKEGVEKFYKQYGAKIY